MDPWQKESLGLQVGDTIIWQDEAVEVEGRPALVAPGMKGKVLSLHDGFYVSQQLGHANPQITFRVYAHWIPNNSQRKAVNRLPSLRTTVAKEAVN
jgi:hypothetical protein